MVMALLAGRGLTLASASVIRYLGALIEGARSAASAPIKATTKETALPTDRSARLALRVLLAVLLAIPLLLLFGALLTTADPVFGRLVRTAFGIDVGRLISHAVVITILSWSAGGYVLALLHRGGTPHACVSPTASEPKVNPPGTGCGAHDSSHGTPQQ
jgi:hypothetical protein